MVVRCSSAGSGVMDTLDGVGQADVFNLVGVEVKL